MSSRDLSGDLPLLMLSGERLRHYVTLPYPSTRPCKHPYIIFFPSKVFIPINIFISYSPSSKNSSLWISLYHSAAQNALSYAVEHADWAWINAISRSKYALFLCLTFSKLNFPYMKLEAVFVCLLLISFAYLFNCTVSHMCGLHYYADASILIMQIYGSVSIIIYCTGKRFGSYGSWMDS